MPNAEQRARQLSCLYYNQGLERASVRDLYGAEVKLRQSLQLNKRNTHARNLLGLVCYETGDVVNALQEWMISQHFQAKDNIASVYLKKVQADKATLQILTDNIKTYNRALENCTGDNDDIAAIQLRRIVSKDPRFVRAAQLLALIEMKNGKPGQALKVLKRASRVDCANPLTLRYIKEAEGMLGAMSPEKRSQEAGEQNETGQAPATSAAKPRFFETTGFSVLLNIVIGLVVGLLFMGFIVVPAIRSSISKETNDKIVEYTTTVAEQKDRIANLESQIEESNTVVDQAQSQLKSTKQESDSYSNLIQAYSFFANEEYLKAGDAIQKVDVALLSTEAAMIYNQIKESIEVNAYDEYCQAGGEALFQGDYDKAISYLEKACSIRIDEQDENLNNLANACLTAGKNDKAIAYYQLILDLFPDTAMADNAAYGISILGGTPDYNNTAGHTLANAPAAVAAIAGGNTSPVSAAGSAQPAGQPEQTGDGVQENTGQETEAGDAVYDEAMYEYEAGFEDGYEAAEVLDLASMLNNGIEEEQPQTLEDMMNNGEIDEELQMLMEEAYNEYGEYVETGGY
ncbi:MAG: tetratricopeptide repeat protein [Eubacterium sp.]|nr:tetratricopeptide repeat protein [Eubacterium sp.]